MHSAGTEALRKPIPLYPSIHPAAHLFFAGSDWVGYSSQVESNRYTLEGERRRGSVELEKEGMGASTHSSSGGFFWSSSWRRCWSVPSFPPPPRCHPSSGDEWGILPPLPPPPPLPPWWHPKKKEKGEEEEGRDLAGAMMVSEALALPPSIPRAGRRRQEA